MDHGLCNILTNGEKIRENTEPHARRQQESLNINLTNMKRKRKTL